MTVAQGAWMVIADMTATTFCDSAGVTALVGAVRKANSSGAGLRVAASAPTVIRVLGITGVDQLIEIYPSVAAAMADPGSETAHQGPAAHSGPAGQADPGGQADPDGHAPQPG